MAKAGVTHDCTIATIGGTALGFMFPRDRRNRRPFVIQDHQSLAPRQMTMGELTAAEFPAEVELTWTQDFTSWRRGIGGLHHRHDEGKLFSAVKVVPNDAGHLVLARLLTAMTVDSNPTAYVPSGFARAGTLPWAFIGRDVYFWDYTNKQWDKGTVPVAATRIHRNGTQFEDNIYVPAWADDVGSGGSYEVDDEPAAYIYKASADAQWSLSTLDPRYFKYFTVADNKLWGGYVVDVADSTLDLDGPVYAPTTATSVSALASSATTITLSNHVTPAGYDRVIIVTVAARRAAGGAVPTGVTYDGNALTIVPSGSTTNGVLDTSIWYRVLGDDGASATTADVVVTWAATHEQMTVGAISLNGVDQSTPIEAGNTATGSSTAPSVAITTDARDWVVDSMVSADSGVATVGAGQTQRWQENTAGPAGAGSTEEATGGSTTMSWTTANDAWAIAAVAINPASTVGTGDTILYTGATPSGQFVAGDVIRIGTELMLVTAVTDDPIAVTVVRGYRGTVDATHTQGTDINEITENVHHVRSTTDGTNTGSWASATVIGDSSSAITALVGAGIYLFVIKTDGIYVLESDGGVTDVFPEMKGIRHPDFGRGSYLWQKHIYIPTGVGGGLLRFNVDTWVLEDISLTLSMPDLTEYHGRVCAFSGEVDKLYLLVVETGNTQYHLLSVSQGLENELIWSHHAEIAYTTGTDEDHAALLTEAIPSGATIHHRVLIGIESTGSSLLPNFLPDDDDVGDAFENDADGEAVSVEWDKNLPNVDMRLDEITIHSQNHGSGGSDHFSEWQYSLDGAAYDWITGTRSTSKVTSSPQTINFADAKTGKKIKWKVKPTRGTTTSTSPLIESVTIKAQIRTATLKLLPMQIYLADEQQLLNGSFGGRPKLDLAQLETWNAQSAEVTVVDSRGTSRSMVFLKGAMRVEELSNEYSRRPEYLVKFLLAEV